jgi:hypothetical protein
MAQTNFLIDELGNSLITRINKGNIFPPLYNNPESFVPLIGSNSKKPPNSFILCLKMYRRKQTE